MYVYFVKIFQIVGLQIFNYDHFNHKFLGGFVRMGVHMFRLKSFSRILLRQSDSKSALYCAKYVFSGRISKSMYSASEWMSLARVL